MGDGALSVVEPLLGSSLSSASWPTSSLGGGGPTALPPSAVAAVAGTEAIRRSFELDRIEGCPRSPSARPIALTCT